MGNNWKKAKLGSLCKIQSGGTPRRNNEQFYNGTIPWIKISDIENAVNNYILSTEETITPKGLESIHGRLFPKNTVLLAMYGSVGKTAITSKEMSSNQAILGLIPLNSEILDFRFLKYWLDHIKQSLINRARGVALQNISATIVKDLEIPVPPLSEQKRIVSILDKANELIEKRKEAIELLEEYLKSVFLDMFGDPISNPKGWETKTIEEIVKKNKNSIKRGPFGGALKKDIFKGNGYLVYEQYHALNNDFTMARYFIDEKKFIEMKMFEVIPGDIIISCSGVYLGKLAVVPEGALKGIINQALLKITLDESIMLNEFFLSVFTNENFKKMYFENKIGSGIPNFPPMTEFKKFKFICPPLSVQKKYNSLIQKQEKVHESMRNQLQTIYYNFNNLMKEYFNEN